MRAMRRSLTLFEIAIGLVVLLVLLFGYLSATHSSINLSERSRQHDLACATARSTLERLRSVSPDAAAAAFNGQDVPIEALRDGRLRVRMLSEADAGIALGTALDLDGDGVVSETAPPHVGMRIHCAEIRVTWTGLLGEPQELHQLALLYPRVGEDL